MSAARWKVGDLVRYSDIANPGATYIVVEVNDCPWSTYLVRRIDAPHGGEYTDGRQAGWEVLS
jgi:hypothetical protein